MIAVEHNNAPIDIKSMAGEAKRIHQLFKTKYALMPMFQFESHLEIATQSYESIKSLLPGITDVVVLGTGGSSLGAQVLCSFAEPSNDINIHFFDNIDPLTFEQFWKTASLKRCLFLVVSKSGSTPETLTQALAVVQRLQKDTEVKSIANHMVMITEPKDSPLTKLAKKHGCVCVEHHKGVGGRFSVLSVVGLLPALIMGLNVTQLVDGAQHAYNTFCNSENISPVLEGALLMHEVLKQNKVNECVLMPYIDKLEPLGRWFRQLWAESLGKDGLGSTPINAMGTVDQHSQLQLYLDGPKNKCFTVIHHPLVGRGDVINKGLAKEIGLDFIAGKTMADLMQAEQDATTKVLINSGSFVRSVKLGNLSLEVLGQLLIMFIIETVLMAELMGVNCFNQPAVEQGKKITKQLLEGN